MTLNTRTDPHDAGSLAKFPLFIFPATMLSLRKSTDAYRKRQAERRSAASCDPFCFAHAAGVISAIWRLVIVGSRLRTSLRYACGSMPRLRQLVMIE